MAKSKLSDFKNNVASGFARSNLFEVTLGTNTNLTKSTLPTNTSFLIKSASLPSSNIGTIAIPYQGRVFNVPGDRTFDSWSTTIINTEAFETRKFIESWINDIQRKDLNFSMAGNLDYTTTLTVTALKRDGAGKDTLDMARKYQFHHAFPSSLSAIDLDFASNDAVEEFTCEWQYSHWTVIEK